MLRQILRVKRSLNKNLYLGLMTFQLGPYSLTPDPIRCRWEIDPLTRALAIRGNGKAEAPLPEELTGPGGDRSGVSFTVSVHGVYVAEGPQGRFTFTDGRSEMPSQYFYTEGLDTGLYFSGAVTVTPRGVTLTGTFGPRYDDRPSYPVAIELLLSPGGPDWPSYRFRSMEEVMMAAADGVRVRYVSLLRPNFAELPPALLRLTQLEELEIVNDRQKPLPLADLAPGIENLRQLRKLTISGCRINRLPAEVGDLRQLTHLRCTNCFLTAVDPAVLRLPALEYLVLQRNRLASLFARPELPALQVLDIAHNELTKLSPVYARLPQLRELVLTGNRWVELPKELDEVAQLELEITEKQRFFDYTYRGAGRRGTVSWDEAIFRAAGDATLTDPLRRLLTEEDLTEHLELLVYLGKRSVGFSHTVPETYSQLGNHRFGGRPDLPTETPYPTFTSKEGKTLHYEFIAQLNCAELAPLQTYLPRRGMLYFFLSTMHDIYDSGLRPYPVGLVLYATESSNFESAGNIVLEENDFFELKQGMYQPFRVTAAAQLSIPSFYAIGANEYLLTGPAAVLEDTEDDELFETLDWIDESLQLDFPHDHAVNGYGFSQHEFPELEAAGHLRGKAEDWTILLKVSSVGDFQWGDAGYLYYVIHKSDLARADFSNVYITMYSS